MSHVYLDVNIGDSAQHQRDTVEYEQSCALLRSCESYGFKSTFEDMSDDERGSFAEFAAASHPTVTLRISKPASLLVGRIVLELFDEDAPKACENFRALLVGDRGLGKVSGKPLHYLSAPFHRIIPGFMAQGGDFVFGDGSGKETVFGKPTFNDEKGGLKRKFDARGLLAMANSGKNSNSCQFFVTFGAAAQLNGAHVVFGKIADGDTLAESMEVLSRLERVGTASGKPALPVSIAACGQCSPF